MPNILISKSLKEHQMRMIQEQMPGYEILTEPDEAKLAETEVIIHWTAAIQKLWDEGKFPNVKWVQAISAGINYLPLAELEERGIILTNGSGIHKYTITEYVMGALLYYLRDFPQLRKNKYSKKWDQKVRVEQLHEKTMMIFGIGNIGRQLATVAKAFGMHVIGVNTSGNSVAEVDETVAQDASLSRLADADIVVSILPQTPETMGFFNPEKFSAMRPGTLFVNVGRGSSVDDAALIEALDNGTLAFAALDVFHKEPLEEANPLWEHEKVFISPHNSGTVAHFRDALFTVIGPNVEAYARDGKPTINVINYDKSY